MDPRNLMRRRLAGTWADGGRMRSGARRRGLAGLGIALAVGIACIPAQAQAHADDPADAAATDAAQDTAAATDEAARLFMMKCAGCHTIGGGPLTGPDLGGTSAWPLADLAKSIGLMEEQVGPLQTSEIDVLAAFLQHDDRLDRLRVERERVALEQAASFEAGSAAIGRQLFSGAVPLANRGLACTACHAAGGDGGGIFAPNLTDAFERMGELPLLSACEGANFPVMRASYAGRPILKQEAIHLVAYLESVSGMGEEASRAGPVIVTVAGLAMAALCMAGVFVVSIRRNGGTRAELVRKAIRQNSP